MLHQEDSDIGKRLMILDYYKSYIQEYARRGVRTDARSTDWKILAALILPQADHAHQSLRTLHDLVVSSKLPQVNSNPELPQLPKRTCFDIMAEDDFESNTNAFLTWLHENGFLISTKCSLMDLRGRGRGRGISRFSHLQNCHFLNKCWNEK